VTVISDTLIVLVCWTRVVRVALGVMSASH